MKCECCERPDPADLIFETRFWKVLLSPDQAYLGRSYVTLKRHCGDLKDLEEREWLDFLDVVKRIENALRKSFGSTMFNWACMMNSTYSRKTPDPHVHWHLRPRYDHSVVFAGTEFRDPEFGHHYSKEREHNVSSDARKPVASTIRKNL